MRALVQRVREASVEVDGAVVGRIGPGLLVLCGFAPTDTDRELAWMAEKCAKLRIFADDAGKMNRSLVDLGLAMLVVSQFTLYGDAARGNRPSFGTAAPPALAEALYERFCAACATACGRAVERGRFAAHMQVGLVNDGPVTIWLEREAGAGG